MMIKCCFAVLIPEKKKRNDGITVGMFFGFKKVICQFNIFRNDGFSGKMATVGMYRHATKVTQSLTMVLHVACCYIYSNKKKTVNFFRLLCVSSGFCAFVCQLFVTL